MRISAYKIRVGDLASAPTAPVVTSEAVDFGAKTLINSGDYALTASGSPTSWNITGGTASSQYNIDSSGVLTSAVANPTGGTLTVTATNGVGTSPAATITVNSVANTYSAADATQVGAAITAAAASDAVQVRDVVIEEVNLSTLTKSSVTVSCDTAYGATFRRILFTSVDGVTFSQITVSNPNTAQADPSISTNAACVINSCTDVLFNDVVVDNTADDGEDYMLSAFRFDSTTRGGVTNSDISWCYKGIVGEDTTDLDATNTEIYDIRDSFHSHLRPEGLILDGINCYKSRARLTNIYYGTITGTLTVGEYITDGTDGGQVKAITLGATDEVTIVYNGGEKPDNGDNLVGATGSFLINATPPLNVGTHADGVHIFNNSAVADSAPIASMDQFIMQRGSKAVTGSLDTYQAFTGIRIQEKVGQVYNDVRITRGLLACDHPETFEVDGLSNGWIEKHTILQSTETAGGSSRMHYTNCDLTTIRDVVVDFGPVDSGGNTNMTLTNNYTMTDGQYAAEFPDFDRVNPPYVLADWAPDAASAVETASTGTLDSAAAYRSLFVPASSPALLNSATGVSAASTTTTLSSFTPSAGSDKMLVVVVSTEDTDGGLGTVSGVTWGATNLTQGSAQSGGSFNTYAMYYAAIGSSTATNDIVVTLTAAPNKGAVVGAFVIENVKQIAPTLLSETASGISYPQTKNETISAAGMMVGCWFNAIEQTFSAGTGNTLAVEIKDNTASCAVGATYRVESSTGSYDLIANAGATSRAAYAGFLFEEL